MILYLAGLLAVALQCAWPQVSLGLGMADPKRLGSFPERTRAHASLTELIRRNAYDVEEHFVETSDGYVLGLFRVLPLKKQPFRDHGRYDATYPVILQHGLLDSAATWVVNDPKHSLGFLLVDHGYDVWLATSRGSTFARNHTGFPVDSAHFWDFTLDDMAEYDLPATIEYVRRQTTSQDVALVAHSQGAAIALAALATEAIPTGHLSILVALAPAVYLKYIESVPLQLLAKFHADTLFSIAGRREFLPSTRDKSDLFGEFCNVAPQQCANILTAICGFNARNIDMSRLPVYLAFAPGGTSVKNMAHWAQRVRDAEAGFSFRRYDYGDTCHVGNVRMPCNQRVYGRLGPPWYDLTAISTRSDVRIGVFYGMEDILADPIDTRRVLDALGEHVVVFEKGLLGYQHIDFTWSTNAAEDVYKDVVRLLSSSV